MLGWAGAFDVTFASSGRAAVAQTGQTHYLFGSVGTDALSGELEDRGVVSQAADGSHRGHGIFEGLEALRQCHVGGDDDGHLLVALG